MLCERIVFPFSVRVFSVGKSSFSDGGYDFQNPPVFRIVRRTNFEMRETREPEAELSNFFYIIQRKYYLYYSVSFHWRMTTSAARCKDKFLKNKKFQKSPHI